MTDSERSGANYPIQNLELKTPNSLPHPHSPGKNCDRSCGATITCE
ncbi:hypothetical protein K9N68_25505 [Kovacikia minuta CCNUW1]|nr:hypothetical protein [Kovacikia minuta]UBF24972.1 hypothetical protein K9N68_25505 [Kovacikia minuta CCNUW1]